MSASITIAGETVCALEVPAESMGLPSTQCAWLRGRVNDALTAELAKQQQRQPQDSQPKACSSAAGENDDEDNGDGDGGEEEETSDV